MAKKSKLIAEVFEQLQNMGKDEIMHYVREFKNEIDYNIVQYGNLLIYYADIRELLEYCEYKVQNYTDEQIWNYYKHIVREVVNKFFIK